MNFSYPRLIMDGLSFRRQKYNIENAKSSIWRDFFKKEQKSSFKKSEAPNLLIINPNF